MTKKYYVGLIRHSTKRELIYTAFTPKEEDYPEYFATIGPFKTKRGAVYCQRYGFNNPHIQCVEDAERLAALESK